MRNKKVVIVLGLAVVLVVLCIVAAPGLSTWMMDAMRSIHSIPQH